MFRIKGQLLVELAFVPKFSENKFHKSVEVCWMNNKAAQLKILDILLSNRGTRCFDFSCLYTAKRRDFVLTV